MQTGTLWALGAGALLAGAASVFRFQTEPLLCCLGPQPEVRVAHVSVGKHHDFSWEAFSDQLPTAVRLRERVDARGRVFRNQAGFAAALAPVPAQIFTPEFRGPTTNLQLEVIVTLPTAEFFVQAPKLPRKGRKTIHDPF